jgi:uncharacterized damage-inducible protein DinB
MNEVERITDQYQRAFDGEAWHGPSVLSLLEGVTATQASAHPIPGAHSIWELTVHIAAWESAISRRLRGDRAQLSDSEDWPIINDTREEAWQSTIQQLVANHQALLDEISKVDQAKLDRSIIEDPQTPFSSIYVTLHGGVQHDLYHAGQIAILKKALDAVASS